MNANPSAQLLLLDKLLQEMQESVASNPFTDSAPSQNTLTVESKDAHVQLEPEETQAILNKLQSYVASAAGTVPQDEALYIEQQVAELLGFEVELSKNGLTLPFSYGQMAGSSHAKMKPSITSAPDHLKEAGFSPQRPFFGWFQESELPRYTIQANLLQLPEWSEQYPSIKSALGLSQMFVINPYEGLGAAAVLTDVVYPHQSRYQFGGSPELIRDLKIWSPSSLGKVWVFFLPTPIQPDSISKLL